MLIHQISQLCPYRVEKYDPGYHFDDSYECELVITDLRDNSCWRISVTLQDPFGDQVVAITNLLR